MNRPTHILYTNTGRKIKIGHSNLETIGSQVLNDRWVVHIPVHSWFTSLCVEQGTRSETSNT